MKMSSGQPKSRASAILRASSDFAGMKLRKALSEFDSLGPEIRAAYGDRFIQMWASDFEFVWPMFYEVLAQFERDELFKQEKRAGKAYTSFQEYFEDRLKVPFERWASLEQTYQYVSKYAPEMFVKTFAAAKVELENANKLMRSQRHKAVDAADNANKRPAGRPAGETVRHNKNVPHNNERPATYTAAANLRRLRKDRPRSTLACWPGSLRRTPAWSRPGSARSLSLGSYRRWKKSNGCSPSSLRTSYAR
jgi:hypothetical protein